MPWETWWVDCPDCGRDYRLRHEAAKAAGEERMLEVRIIRMPRGCYIAHGDAQHGNAVGFCENMVRPGLGANCRECGHEYVGERLIECPTCGGVYRLIHPGAGGRHRDAPGKRVGL